MKAEEILEFPLPLKCSVVVTTWRRPVLLRDTLEALERQTYESVEVVVVSDGEDSDVRAISEEFQMKCPVRWVFHSENLGLPAARNTGARIASGEIVLFLDDDVRADSELVAAHMRPHIAAGSGRRLAVWSLATEDRYERLTSFVEECLHEAWRRSLESLSRSMSAIEVDSVGEEIEKGICFGLNCSIRRDVFLSLGGFNEHFRASDEEMELGLRLYLAGVEFVFEPGFLLTHQNSKNLERYFLNCWNASGGLDTYRVFEMGQKNAQTQRLVSMFHGFLLNRMAARVAWHLAGPLRSLSGGLKTAAERKRSHFLFSAWARTSQAAEHWNAAKAAGCTLARLKGAVGPSNCAMMLHSISEPDTNEEARYYIRPRRFHRLMRWFHATGHRTATLAQWIENNVPQKHVLLTFDDAYDDLYDELLPLVARYHYTPVVFVVADRVGGSNVWDQENGLRARKLLTLGQILEMQKYGVVFGSHTLTHPWLPHVSNDQLWREVSDSKHRLEDMLGAEVTSFAYPFGGVDRRVRSAVADAGYKMAFTTQPGLNWWNDPLCQRRAEVNDYTTVLDFALKLRSGRSIRQYVGARLHSLEEDLPTQGLRRLAGRLRRTGRAMFHRDE